MIFQTDTFIPLDSVVKRSGTDVFINVPKLVIGAMPWSEPPEPVKTQAKFGPPADAVEKLYGTRSPSVYEETFESKDEPMARQKILPDN